MDGTADSCNTIGGVKYIRVFSANWRLLPLSEHQSNDRDVVVLMNPVPMPLQ